MSACLTHQRVWTLLELGSLETTLFVFLILVMPCAYPSEKGSSSFLYAHCAWGGGIILIISGRGGRCTIIFISFAGILPQGSPSPCRLQSQAKGGDFFAQNLDRDSPPCSGPLDQILLHSTLRAVPRGGYCLGGPTRFVRGEGSANIRTLTPNVTIGWAQGIPCRCKTVTVV